MKVGVEYTLAARHAPGPGRYVRELVRAAARLDDRPELALFEGGRVPVAMPDAALGLDRAARVTRRHVPLPRRALLAAGRLRLGPDRWLGGVDLLHHAHVDGLAASSAREVLPAAELPADAALARLRAAWRVVVFSRFMRDHLAARGVDPAAIAQVPVGADHWARDLPAGGAEAAPADGAPAVVAVLGALRPERFPDVVLAACERLTAGGRPVALELYGRDPGAIAGFEAARAASPVPVGRSIPSEAEIPGLLARAAALVHLEERPGTPVTPLEAMALGVPVVASRAPAFVEALGDAATWVDDPRDASALADAIDAVLPARDAWAARGREVARPYTWDANARATVDVWRQA